MSGLDYSTFSIRSALTPSQPVPARSYPADPIQQHVAEDVIDSHICNMQRDDLPSCTEMPDRPRERALTLSESYQGQGPSSRMSAIPRSPLPSDSADDAQGNILCAQLGGFHFTPQYGGHGRATVDEPVNTPATIMENSSWGSHHSLRYPIPVHGSLSQCIKAAGGIPEDARPGLSSLHCDVNVRAPVRRASMAVTDRQFGTSHDLRLAGPGSLPLPPMAVDVTTFLPSGLVTSPSSPALSTAYDDDDVLGADCTHTFPYAEQLPAMTTTRKQGDHYLVDRQTVRLLAEYQDTARPGIMSLDHPFAGDMATPLPGYPSSQSPHDHPICEPPSFGTALHTEELPRPGSAPPLMDSQVPFIGDARAALQSPEHTAYGDHVSRPHVWYPQAVSPSAGQSPRSSPRRAGSIGHNSQKTPPGSRYLRRWSSVTNPALRASPPFPSSFAPNLIPFPRYPVPQPAPPSAPSSTDNSLSHFSPSAESESDDPSSVYTMPHGAVDVAEAMCADQPQPQQVQQVQQQPPPTRSVIRCDGHLIDEESWTAALQRPDKLLHVYECFWDVSHSSCGMWIEGDQSSVADHLALFHGFRGGEVTTRCLWRDCPKPHMKGTSIARHVVTHIGFRIKCNTCKHEFARVDACNRAHSRSGCLGVGQPMYGDLQRVLDARKVDPLQRPCKKRRMDD